MGKPVAFLVVYGNWHNHNIGCPLIGAVQSSINAPGFSAIGGDASSR